MPFCRGQSANLFVLSPYNNTTSFLWSLSNKKIIKKEENSIKHSSPAGENTGICSVLTSNSVFLTFGKRVFLDIEGRRKEVRHAGSMTLEAALVLPIFFFFCLTFLRILNLLSFENRVTEEMYDTIRAVSKIEYTKESTASPLLAAQLVGASVGNDRAKAIGVLGGSYGMLPVESDFSGEDMDFRLQEVVCNPFAMILVRPLACRQTAYLRKWIGDADDGTYSSGDLTSSSELVFITTYGEVYHRDASCSYLNPTVTPVAFSRIGTYRSVDGRRYGPCEVCGAKAGGTVYITDYGECYHSTRNCLGIKRGIMCVELSSIPGWKPCSKCGGGHG